MLQVMLNVLSRRMAVNEAVAAGRVHHQWLPDEVRVERGLPPGIVKGLGKRGHVVKETKGVGNVQAIGRRGD